ncbi:MAG: hypothetical protein ABSB32_11370 [Thermodesulfobacteriota bacterium]|jgi:hypothetical protein
MTNVDQNEEIIELTDVIKEKLGPGGKDRLQAFSPSASEEKTTGPAPDQRSDKNLEPPKEESRPLSLTHESEGRAMRESPKVGAEEWMASEGVRILEQVAREMFPQIAREVLRQEIEKLKAEVKRQE